MDLEGLVEEGRQLNHSDLTAKLQQIAETALDRLRAAQARVVN